MVAWRAGRMEDPIARLRYLQGNAAGRRKSSWPRAHRAWLLAIIPLALVAVLAPLRMARAGSVVVTRPEGVSEQPVSVAVAPAAEVWIVEKNDEGETYSNGLRIDNQFATATHLRSYLAFPADPHGRAERHSDPAGIVFHTTESLQAPFEPGENGRLQRIGQSLLEFVKERRSYNFVIDRFGRVYRIVREEDAANHAGHSVWSDTDHVYVNLNDSFLGIAFETQTLPGQYEATVSPAQLHAAAMLTDVLRRRYGIAASNCVTHAQVSVNVSNLQIGYHLDWASSFPFAQIGLPDNYTVPLPSVAQFGFGYDPGFARRAGGRMFQEAEMGDQLMREHAAAAHVDAAAYRRELQQRYRTELAAMRGDGRSE